MLNIHLNYNQAIPDSSWCIPRKMKTFLQKDLLMLIVAILIANDWTCLVAQL